MATIPKNVTRVHDDSAYISKLLHALQDFARYLQAAHAEDVVIDPKKWSEKQSRGEVWLRELLRMGFNENLTAGDLYDLLSKRAGVNIHNEPTILGSLLVGDVQFFNEMRRLLSEFAQEVANPTPPNSDEPRPFADLLAFAQSLSRDERTALELICGGHAKSKSAPGEYPLKDLAFEFGWLRRTEQNDYPRWTSCQRRLNNKLETHEPPYILRVRGGKIRILPLQGETKRRKRRKAKR
jgi:hypothetical protein